MSATSGDPPERLVTIPNALSALRLVLAPVLLWLAWSGRPTPFLVTLAISLLSDLVDGWLARRFRPPRSAHCSTAGATSSPT